jgi:hypothetical protein
MKRVALLMGGELRNFNECFPSWNNQGIDFDLFLSTWSTSHLFSNNATSLQHLNSSFEVNPELIESITHKKPKYLNIEAPINFEHRGNNQIYHWHKLLTTLINLKNDYDIAIITRPDTCIANPKSVNMLEIISKDKIYGASTLSITEPCPFLVSVNDWFFMANPLKLIDILLPVPYMKVLDEDMIRKHMGDNMHTHLAHYFVANRHYIDTINEIAVYVDSYDKRVFKGLK